MVTEKGSASWPGIAGFECFKFCLVWGVEQLYIRVPLYRCTSMYIGRGQVLFQNLFLTYSPPILGRSDDEICVMHKSRFWLISRPSSPKNKHPCSFLGYKFAGANLLLLGTTALLGSFDTLRIFSSGTWYRTLPKPFANRLSGSVRPCTLPDASFCIAKTSLLLITPDIPVRPDTLRIFQ